MTWQNARKDAEERVRALLADLAAQGIDPHGFPIALSIYDDQDMLDLMQPDNTWPLAYHQQVMRAAARILAARKLKVRLVPMALGDYQAWLGDQENTAAMRAAFAAMKMS